LAGTIGPGCGLAGARPGWAAPVERPEPTPLPPGAGRQGGRQAPAPGLAPAGCRGGGGGGGRPRAAGGTAAVCANGTAMDAGPGAAARGGSSEGGDCRYALSAAAAAMLATPRYGTTSAPASACTCGACPIKV